MPQPPYAAFFCRHFFRVVSGTLVGAHVLSAWRRCERYACAAVDSLLPQRQACAFSMRVSQTIIHR